MDLREYLLAIERGQRAAFAERCGTTLSHIRNVGYRSATCGEKLAIAIERESIGVVRCEDLRPDVDWAYLRGTKRTKPRTADSQA